MSATDLQARAIVPERFVILGQRLLPLAVGHVELFARLGVERILTPADLVLAVVIAAHRPREVMPFLESPFFRLRLWFWGLRLGNWDFVSKREIFQTYLAHHMETPEVALKGKGDCGGSNVPFVQHLRAVLLSKLGYDPERIEDAPYARAIWDYYAWAETEGTVTVLPQTSSEIRAAIDALDHDAILKAANNPS